MQYVLKDFFIDVARFIKILYLFMCLMLVDSSCDFTHLFDLKRLAWYFISSIWHCIWGNVAGILTARTSRAFLYPESYSRNSQQIFWENKSVALIDRLTDYSDICIGATRGGRNVFRTHLNTYRSAPFAPTPPPSFAPQIMIFRTNHQKPVF